MKRNFTIEDKAQGELAVRQLSDKAQKFYNGTDPFTVYAYRDWDADGCYTWFHAYDDGITSKDGLTLEELDQELCAMAEVDFWDFKQMNLSDKIAYIESLDRWDDVDPEFYEWLCKCVALDYHSYDDPDVMWADIKDRAENGIPIPDIFADQTNSEQF